MQTTNVLTLAKQLFYDSTMKTILEKAVELCGGQTALANAIGVQQPHVWNWINRSHGVAPAEYCIKIEAATNSQVTRYDLRPDVFGEAPEKEKAA